jgi:hypothetical protein
MLDARGPPAGRCWTVGNTGAPLPAKSKEKYPEKGTNMKLKSKFAVGKYTCEMSYKPDEGRLDAEWLPDVPPAKSFSKMLMAQYRAGRDAFIKRIAAEIGLNVMVVEV